MKYLSLILTLTLISITIQKHPVLYEISTRPWLYELSKKYSKPIKKLRDIPDSEFEFLKNKGIDFIWMMGVWKLGPYGLSLDQKSDYSQVLPGWTKEDVIGSPYAISEYVCNPEIGNDDDLIWLKSKLNSMGMKLMLDFVPNHSSCDAPTADSNPDFYVRAPKELSPPYDSKYYTEKGLAHGKDPYFDPWPDVIQWNYFNEDTRKLMRKNLMKVLSVADGVRCDMAHLLLNDVFKKTWEKELKSWGYNVPSSEFWDNAIKEIKAKYPNVIFLAEVYEKWEIDKLTELGFDYCYDKELLDQFEKGPNEINDYIHYKSESFFLHSSHFIENHDENRGVYNMGSVEKSNAAGVIAATIGGMIFFNHGQFSGLKNKLDVHLRRSLEEKTSDLAVKHYDNLLRIIKDDAFKSKNYYFVYNINGYDAWRFIGFIRKEINSYLIVVNYSDNYACANVPIYDVRDNLVYEMFSQIEYERDARTMKSTGLTVCIPAYQSQIFKYNYQSHQGVKVIE